MFSRYRLCLPDFKFATISSTLYGKVKKKLQIAWSFVSNYIHWQSYKSSHKWKVDFRTYLVFAEKFLRGIERRWTLPKTIIAES